MARRKKSRRSGQRKRVGRVSFYAHHGAWYVYYREGNRQVRRRVADSEEAAERVAAQINGQLATGSPTTFSFIPLSVTELRRRFLEHHEHVRRSSLATVRRYRAATQHLEDFAAEHHGSRPAHEVDVEGFVSWLRTRRVSPNGHPNTARRPLRDKGYRYVLEVCRSLYSYAAKRRHLPPYSDNPFSLIDIERMRGEDAKPVFVFDEEIELRFFQRSDDWGFPVHFTLAKTGLRPGELVHLLIEDIDLETGWLHVRNKPELGWRIKTGRERSVPLISELVNVLRRTIGARTAGPVFIRQRASPSSLPLANSNRADLQHELELKIGNAEAESGCEIPLSRQRQSQIAASVWRDAGVVRPDRIRQSFLRTTAAIGVPNATCPKSWRHTFATLLQDANVDPLVRQITLGHKPTDDVRGGLGMTGVYTHTRADTQKREIERALRHWPRSLEYAQLWANRYRTAQS